MSLTMEERAAAYVAKMDGAVAKSGGHNQTFYVACVLMHGFRLTESAAMSIMREWNARCAPPWSEPDLVYKIQSAARSAASSQMQDLWAKVSADNRDDARFSRPAEAAEASDAELPPIERPQWPEHDAGRLREFAGVWRESVSSVWLANRSAVDPCRVDAAGFLDVLYPEAEKVLVFTNQRSQGQAVWPDESLPAGAAEGVWFLPQPVDGKYHPNPRSVDKDGKPKSSRRSMESVTAWRYMLLESDEADMRDWLGLLVQLPLRVAAIYSSGGRSVHVLIRIDRPTKDSWDQAKAELLPTLNLLCVAGIDMKAVTAVRLSRLPQCMRGKRLQKLFYVNPNPSARPLCELPMLRDVEADWCGMAAGGVAESDDDGGQWLFDGLGYYASASVRCKNALEDLREIYG
ncbi:hypothetical protein QEH52_01690 [Coraliomargarita sp. SDUM461003]|uniref:Primase C-terminal 2 domain-containing protein n=1 Tax=Thalassobacterium maritimum TaxID=3041265 RepID=A0ABU1APV7_9BACT|nr:hypothetical protein [Coraliomargarita sp. SDUM461003]MDQ8206204.1 hypothetical protein [Coraliomargarita sp. SDUM461003]